MNSLINDTLELISKHLRVRYILLLRATKKSLLCHNIHYCYELKKKEKKKDIILKLIYSKLSKFRAQKLFVDRLLSDEKFRDTYIRVYQKPVKHICFKNHQPSPYISRLFKKFDIFLNLLDEANLNFMDHVMEESQMEAIIKQYNLKNDGFIFEPFVVTSVK